MQRLIVFDLDGTWAEGQASIDAQMGTLLNTIAIRDPHESDRVIPAVTGRPRVRR